MISDGLYPEKQMCDTLSQAWSFVDIAEIIITYVKLSAATFKQAGYATAHRSGFTPAAKQIYHAETACFRALNRKA